MQNAIAQLEIAAQVAENNAPISLAEGDTAQAELQQAVAQDCREAIEKLQENA
ncbi:hypothetical protein D9M69_519390 [compost metagenome]